MGATWIRHIVGCKKLQSARFPNVGANTSSEMIIGNFANFEDKTAAIAEDAMDRFEGTDEDMIRSPEPTTMYA